MCLHISLEDELVAQLDRRIGRSAPSAFIVETLRRALEEERARGTLRAAARRLRWA